MKTKSLHYSKGGHVNEIAGELGRVHGGVCDQLPPAYPCEGEKVVFVGVVKGTKLAAPVVSFCKDLNPSRTKNVAFYCLTNAGTSAIDALSKTMEANGVHVMSDILQLNVKCGAFAKGMPTQADIDKAVEWSNKICESEELA